MLAAARGQGRGFCPARGAGRGWAGGRPVGGLAVGGGPPPPGIRGVRRAPGRAPHVGVHARVHARRAGRVHAVVKAARGQRRRGHQVTLAPKPSTRLGTGEATPGGEVHPQVGVGVGGVGGVGGGGSRGGAAREAELGQRAGVQDERGVHDPPVQPRPQPDHAGPVGRRRRLPGGDRRPRRGRHPAGPLRRRRPAA